MRTRTEDLLSIRDDEPMDAELRARLLADSDCLAEIDRLREVRESMRRLPQLEPPPDCWENIVSATVDRSRAGRNGRGRLAAGVAAAAAAGLLLWGLARDVAPPRPDTPPAAATTPAGESTPTPDPTANPSPLVIAPDAHPAASGDPAAESPDVAAALVSSGSEAAGAAPSHAALLVESARLERLLEALPRQRPIMTAGTAGTIAALEDRIYFIDGQLTLGAAQGLEPKQQLALWRERIDVMDALVKVRYAQAQPLIY